MVLVHYGKKCCQISDISVADGEVVCFPIGCRGKDCWGFGQAKAQGPTKQLQIFPRYHLSTYVSLRDLPVFLMIT